MRQTTIRNTKIRQSVKLQQNISQIMTASRSSNHLMYLISTISQQRAISFSPIRAGCRRKHRHSANRCWRSEERRVGKEWRARWSTDAAKEDETEDRG